MDVEMFQVQMQIRFQHFQPDGQGMLRTRNRSTRRKQTSSWGSLAAAFANHGGMTPRAIHYGLMLDAGVGLRLKVMVRSVVRVGGSRSTRAT